MPEYAKTSAYQFFLVPGKLQSLYDRTSLVIQEQRHFVVLGIHSEANEFKRRRKQYNLAGGK